MLKRSRLRSILMILVLFFTFFSIHGFAEHKAVYRTIVDEQGKKHLSTTGLFGYCIRCTEVLDHDMVEIIDNDEDWYCSETDCYYPQKGEISKYDLVVEDVHKWRKYKNFVIQTEGSIFFRGNGKIISEGKGAVILKAGMEPGKGKEYKKTITFKGEAIRIETPGGGDVKIYYNPVKVGGEHKYYNYNVDYDVYKRLIKTNNLMAYMLVNNADDLQDMNSFPGSYALSQNIMATEAKSKENALLASKNFDANGYSINELIINHLEHNEL